MVVQSPSLMRSRSASAVRRPAPPTLMFGVGAPKCGTTWMHRYLNAHPDCHFRALKELHYFDTLNDFGFNWMLELLEKRILNLEIYSQRVEGEERERSLRELVDARDYFELMRKRIDDRLGYSRFMLDGKGTKTLVGDITPAYALLPAKVMREMAAMTERTRLVYLVREPVERLWSHIRMAVEHEKVAPGDFGARAQELLSEQLTGQLDPKRPLVEYSDYAATITRLHEVAPREKVLVMCYEHLLTRQDVRQLCKFLGIRHVEADLGKTVNEGVPADLPEELRAEARRHLRPQYEFAAKYFKSLPDAWQKTMAEGFA
jgi:hypothetical protein